MKKLFTLLLFCCTVAAFAGNPVNVSFKLRAIDTTGTAVDTTMGVYIVGTITNWAFRPLEDLGDNIYQFDTTIMPNDTAMYYFILVNSWDSAGNQDWNYFKRYREYPDTANTICNPSYTKWKGDRCTLIPSHDTVIFVSWGVCGSYVDPSSVNNKLSLSAMSVYPNPAQGLVNIKVPAAMGKVSFDVYDMTGKLVKSIVSSESTLNMDLSNLSKGVYILNAASKSEKISSKIMLK